MVTLRTLRLLLPSYRAMSLACVMSIMTSSVVFSERAGTLGGREYELIDLGTLGGTTSVGLAADEAGTVVGWSTTDADARRAFVWHAESGMQDLGTLQNGTYSEAAAISASGQWVAGNGGIRPLENPEQFMDIEQGFVWSDDSLQSVGALYNPATFNKRFGTSEVHGINDLGQAVGFSVVARQGLQSAFVWENGVMTDIGHANETAFNSRAFDINNRGQVVGDVVMSTGAPAQAFSWEAGVFAYLQHAGDNTFSTAAAINENGQIAGWSGDDTHTVAVLWSADGVEQLGVLDGDTSSKALDINELGQVVGWSGSEEQPRAFFWDAGVMTDLNTLLAADSDWTLTEATDLDNQGTITGTGLKNGERRAFQLRPVLRSCRSGGR